MSFQEEKRNSIKRYLLEKVRNQDTDYIKKTMDNFRISVTTVKRYLKELLEQGILEEQKQSECGYRLKTEGYRFVYDASDFLVEDKIYFQDILPLLQIFQKRHLPYGATHLWKMMNNAIEHANAEHILCYVKKDALYTEISITDDGIGIFENIRAYLEKECGYSADIQDAILELYKGKLTTQSEAHSGEGIFFVSKVLREFAIWSGQSVFTTGRYTEEKLIQSHLILYYTSLKSIGTMVVMKLENDTTHTLKEVFDMFAPIEEGFVKTVIPLKKVCPYGEPIARSQARRVVYRLEQFKQVEFDCSGIDLWDRDSPMKCSVCFRINIQTFSWKSPMRMKLCWE